MSSPARYTRYIKQKAADLGFMYCGISKAAFLAEEAPRLEKWLQENRHGKMQYMENHFDKRLDPRLLVEGARSVISVILNYYPSQTQHDPEAPAISKYAYGTDYHLVLREKLGQLLESIRQNAGDVHARIFVDSAPVMDKAWAEKGGLGWRGKNTNLIHPRHGSFFFIGEIITDLELEYDGPMKDYCGSCTRCMDACPTDAIAEPYVVDGSKCISYFTIELKESIPEDFRGKFQNWAFGCDICQDVCPWNRFSEPHSEPLLNADPRLLSMRKKEWEELTEETYRDLFRNSAVKRAKYAGLKRNIRFLNNAQTPGEG